MKPLFQIDKDLNTAMMLKILSCYYDLTYQDISWERGRMYFQSIPPFSSDKNDIRNKGWIHQDTASNEEYELAGIIYLNEKIDPDSGTSIFKMVNDNYVTYQRHFAKHLLFKNEKDFDKESVLKRFKIQLENSNVETIHCLKPDFTFILTANIKKAGNIMKKFAIAIIGTFSAPTIIIGKLMKKIPTIIANAMLGAIGESKKGLIALKADLVTHKDWVIGNFKGLKDEIFKVEEEKNEGLRVKALSAQEQELADLAMAYELSLIHI